MSDPVSPSPPPPPPPPQAPPPAQGGGADSNGLMIALSYLWLLALVPLLSEKDNQEVQWHAKHGLVLMVAEVILYFIVGILSTIPVVGCVAVILWAVLALGILVLHIMCIVKGINGERLTVPYVSEWADKF